MKGIGIPPAALGACMRAARFDGMRVEHRDFILANVAEHRNGCRPLG
ncbi:MAG TPA: hypothetical protein VF665_24130 [Longimicrobium sp.]